MTWEVTVKFIVDADDVKGAYEEVDRKIRYNSNPYAFIALIAVEASP